MKKYHKKEEHRGARECVEALFLSGNLTRVSGEQPYAVHIRRNRFILIAVAAIIIISGIISVFM